MEYKIINGAISFSSNTILEEINFEVKGKEKVAIVGRNGAGKSTILKTITRQLNKLDFSYIWNDVLLNISSIPTNGIRGKILLAVVFKPVIQETGNRRTT